MISPVALYEKFSISDTRGLVCTQFKAALNIFLAGDPNISKDGMSEFFHNLLMPAQSKSDDIFLIKFDSISLYVKNINEMFQKNFFQFKKETLRIQDKLNEEMYKKILNTSKTDIELIEEKITHSVVNDIKIDYSDKGDFRMPQTAEQIEKNRIKESIKY